ncbi:MAG TPA: glycosyltransferase family 4 protein [Terriglobales bacterium]|nr:glycosyltransferase family 4 protein [Terriglobales bacterium]
MKRIAIVATHPIQYQAHWFRALAAHPDLDLEVFFCHYATPKEQAEAGFGVEFDWDIPLLDGYPHRFLKNIATTPSLDHFGGLDTPEIRDLIRQCRLDAVINCGWNRKSYWQSIFACRQSGTPVMVRSDSHLHTERPALTAAAKWPVYRLFIPRMDACLAVGQWARDYFLHYGARRDRIFLVPHSIDERWFGEHVARLLPQRAQTRAEWRLPPDCVVFLWAAKFIGQKRPLDFLRALELAARSGIRVHGLMAGDGPLRAEAEAFARERGAPVTFTGFLNQSEMVKAYVACDALDLTSGGETWGLVVNEAMACSRPCIVSDKVGCGPDLITPSTGATYPAGHVEALLARMASFAADRERLRRMGEAAARRVAEYSTAVAVSGVVEAVHSVRRR